MYVRMCVCMHVCVCKNEDNTITLSCDIPSDASLLPIRLLFPDPFFFGNSEGLNATDDGSMIPALIVSTKWVDAAVL